MDVASAAALGVGISLIVVGGGYLAARNLMTKRSATEENDANAANTEIQPPSAESRYDVVYNKSGNPVAVVVPSNQKTFDPYSPLLRRRKSRKNRSKRA